MSSVVAIRMATVAPVRSMPLASRNPGSGEGTAPNGFTTLLVTTPGSLRSREHHRQGPRTHSLPPIAPVCTGPPEEWSMTEAIHMDTRMKKAHASRAMPYIWLRTVARSWRMAARDLYSHIP